jgi:hypothetical protein
MILTVAVMQRFFMQNNEQIKFQLVTHANFEIEFY